MAQGEAHIATRKQRMEIKHVVGPASQPSVCHISMLLVLITSHISARASSVTASTATVRARPPQGHGIIECSAHHRPCLQVAEDRIAQLEIEVAELNQIAKDADERTSTLQEQVQLQLS